MSVIETGGIDCDLHPAVPNIKALHPYLSDHWRDIVIQRGVSELDSLSYPANSPITARPDWRIEGKKPGSNLELLRQHVESFPKICAGEPDAGPIARLSLRERFHWLAAPRSTVIQISPVHTGICESPEAKLEELFDRLVGRPSE